MHLGLDKAAVRLAVIDGIFLQLAFARLIANGAIERMIDEQKLQHAFPHFLHPRCIGVNLHIRRDWGGASNGRFRRLVDFWGAVGIDERFAINSERGRSELDEAHPAVSGHRQLGMITIMRDVYFRHGASLDHGGGNRLAGDRVGHRPGDFDRASVNLHPQLLNWRLQGLWFDCGCNAHSVITR